MDRDQTNDDTKTPGVVSRTSEENQAFLNKPIVWLSLMNWMRVIGDNISYNGSNKIFYTAQYCDIYLSGDHRCY